jgi:hypothetical protein
MITLLLHLLWLLPFLVGGHRQLALENLALRQQLAVYRRLAPRPRLGPADRLFWAGLARVWTGWRRALVIVSPDTVLRWHRRRFREYWSRVSFAERLIGSIRRECLNHVLVLGERHLRRTLSRYFSYSHQARTHLALDKDAPNIRPIALPVTGKIVQFPEVGGLHLRYVRQAA